MGEKSFQLAHFTHDFCYTRRINACTDLSVIKGRFKYTNIPNERQLKESQYFLLNLRLCGGREGQRSPPLVKCDSSEKDSFITKMSDMETSNLYNT